MIALIRKELHLASDVIVGAVVLLVASFPLAFLGVYMQNVKPFPWVSVIGAGCVLNQYTMVLTGAFLGAAAFAREREDESIHFLAFLPVTLSQQYVAKVFTGVVLWIALWIVNVLILATFTLSAGGGISPLYPFLPFMLSICVASFATLGFSSLLGCLISSVTGATFAGIIVLMSTAVIRFFWISVVGDSEYSSLVSLILLGGLGIASLVATGLVFSRNRASVRGFAWSTRSLTLRTVRSVSGKPWGVTTALIWKDGRLLLPSVWIGMSLLSVPFIAATGNAFLSGSTAPGFRIASLVAMTLGWIVLPMWSANSLANEWTSSSYQFLSYLPISSGRVSAIKLGVAAVPAGIVFLVCVVSFVMAERSIATGPRIHASMSWDDFSKSGFLPGAVSYVCALPVTFATAWFFAARLRRKIVAIVLGVLSGPLGMATWAISSTPGGHIAEHFLPVEAIAIHITLLGSLCCVLIVSGTRRISKEGLS